MDLRRWWSFWFAVCVVGSATTVVAGCGSCRGNPGVEDVPNCPAPAVSGDGGETSCAPPEVSGLSAESIAPEATFEKPVYVTQPPGEQEALYVVEKPGRIRVVEDGSVRDEAFLDIRERVGRGFNERGLLGLAFHPEYPENGRFFVYYTPSDAHQNVVAEYEASDRAHRASSEEVRRLVEIDDPEDNHNGGMLTFGPDGHLYVAHGDGGGAGDRHGEIGNGQNKSTLLGSILRLDVDASDRNYAADDNPFVEGEGDPRIWLYGLRNPWRFSFDPETGDLYIGDVGQNQFEEIDVHGADQPGGLNYGWRAYEGCSTFDRSLAGRTDDHQKPVVTFPLRSSSSTIRQGCSVTGGYVYRGEAIDRLDGVYLYGDFCSDDVAAFRYCDGKVVGHRRVPGLEGQGGGLASFGRDNAGELYLVYHGSGEVKKIVSSE